MVQVGSYLLHRNRWRSNKRLVRDSWCLLQGNWWGCKSPGRAIVCSNENAISVRYFFYRYMNNNFPWLMSIQFTLHCETIFALTNNLSFPSCAQTGATLKTSSYWITSNCLSSYEGSSAVIHIGSPTSCFFFLCIFLPLVFDQSKVSWIFLLASNSSFLQKFEEFPIALSIMWLKGVFLYGGSYSIRRRH